MSSPVSSLATHGITCRPVRGVSRPDGLLTLCLARATLQHALDFAWSQDCCKVMLLSGMQRAEAHALYEALGFRGDIERGFVIKPALNS